MILERRLEEIPFHSAPENGVVGEFVMADGKWISDLEATTPLADAARRVLTVRLEVVRDHLPLALDESDKDTEHVHQLRVGTRRAGAALEIFAGCLPEKVYRTARKKLRKVRRAAGEARDWDVFLLGLTQPERSPTPKQRAGFDFLIGYAVAQRDASQAHLQDVAKDYPFSFDRFLAETVAAVHKPHGAQASHTLIDLARPMLSRLLTELDGAAAEDLDDYDNLHQVRITGKQLRYAMEVFADCFARAFREEVYPAVEEMQEMLGRANDSHVATQRLERLREKLRKTLPGEWQRCKTGLDALLRFHRDRLPREQHRFGEWWQRWQHSGGEAAFASLLKSPKAAAS
jgi:CHAD domain-containing protein